MRRVLWLRQAIEQFDVLIRRIASDKPEAAKRFASEIWTKTNQLGQFVSLGRAGRFPGTRELIIRKSYIIVYRVKEKQVHILRVHHVAQDWPTEL